MKEQPHLTPHISHLTIRDLADGSSLIEYPGLSEEEANRRAVAASRRLFEKTPPGFLDAVPGARTLFLEFDPAITGSGRLEPFLSMGSEADPFPPRRVLRIPVAYGGPDGPDLAELARSAGLTPEDFARRHAQSSYRAAFLGFAPGFAYLTGLPQELHAPRLATPRTRIAAGTVAIGGPYTGIYPGATPGGWRLIGRSSIRLFDPSADPPSLLLPGDRVIFEQVERLDSSLPPHPITRSSASAPRASADRPDDAITKPLFRVLSPGVFSSVQGGLRYGWSRYGVPPGGAMDPDALARGNERLGNSPQAAGLEMTYVGAELEVLGDGTACLTGAAPQAEHNGRRIESDEPIRLRGGDRLRVGRILRGARSYLCVEDGFVQSPHPQISHPLRKGDLLRCLVSSEASRVPASPCPRVRDQSHSEAAETVVRVVLGPHEEHFSKEGINTLLASIYRVSASSDRRGIRFAGPSIALAKDPDIPPEGTPAGGIQVAGDGMPIVLGPDRPVTGGYVRIATVISADLPLLGQAVPGQVVRFSQTSLAEAVSARVG